MKVPMQAGISTPPTPEQAKRLADALDESWRVIARHDPEFATVQKYFAVAIRQGAQLAHPSAPPEPPAPARLSRHKQAEIAQTWFLTRQEEFQGRTPPSEARDIQDARLAIPGVARSIIRKFRPIEWRVGRGRKPNSP
jgi:hypothetical protein